MVGSLVECKELKLWNQTVQTTYTYYWCNLSK